MSPSGSVRYLPAGDQGIVVEFGNEIDPHINQQVHNLAFTIKQADLVGIVDLVPTYRSLLVQYSPLLYSYDDVRSALAELVEGMGEAKVAKPKFVEVPVVYGGDYGPDLDFVCEHTGLSIQEVVEIHSKPTYQVYMLGFTPGFPYLGGMDERIATPRLKTPRTRIPGGSVGIAEGQTGVYPIESPGGWQLIGRTPAKLFDHIKDPPAMLEPGDYVRFVPIDEAAMVEITRSVADGSYSLTVSEDEE